MLAPRYVGLLILFVCLFSGRTHALTSEEPPPPEKVFPFTATVVSAEGLRLVWDIAPGYHLYRNKLKFASQSRDITLGEPHFPAGETKHDDYFGAMEVYRDRVAVDLPLKRATQTATELVLEVTAQGCADAGLCYPPYKRVINLTLPPLAGSTDAATKGQKDALTQLGQLLKGASPALPSDELLPPDQAFHFIGEVKDAHTLRVSWQIADGYYLYRERFKFALPDSVGVELGEPDLPHGVLKHEESGPKEVFYHEIGFDLPLKRTTASPLVLSLQAKYQGCAEKGVCYPPMEKTVQLDVPAADANPSDSIPVAPPPSVESPPSTEQDRIAATLKKSSSGLVIASFFGFGLLMAFSPCIFPMIPILSGIIVGHGHPLSTTRAFLLSLAYVLASALAYMAFGVLAGLFGSNLQATLQTPWVIVLFSALFVVLALSMFGFYELQMPSFVQERVAVLSHKQKGGTLWGAAIMGGLSALIVGPCMAAPLAGALIYIGQTGDALLGGSALFSMGLGMGVPLLVLGASAGKLLPRAGIWMNAVKSVFGVIMLAVAVWLIQRIVPGVVAMVLWALLLIVPAIYLNALDALPQPASGWRKLWKGLGVAMLAYGILLLIGAAMNGRDPLQPLRGVAFTGASESPTGLMFRKVHTPAELQRQLDQAKAEGRWLMLDYYADWCVSCVEMERYTFADPKVRAALSKFVLVQADVTSNEDDERALLKNYGLVGPPATLFFGPDGQERKEFRLIGYMEAESFLTHLQKVVR